MVATLWRFWVTTVEFLAILAIVCVGFGTMLRLVKIGDAVKYVGVVGGFVIVLLLLPEFLVSTWSSLLLWQKIGVIVFVVIALVLLGRLRSRTGKGSARHEY